MLAALTPALAAPVVVAELDEPDAVSWGTVTAGAALLVQGGSVRGCTTPPAVPFDEALRDARAAFLYGELATGRATIERALQGLPCEPEPPSGLGEAWRLAGLLAFHSGDPATAERAYRNARAAGAPEAWDEAWPSTSAGLWAVAAPAEQVALRIVPAPDAAWVDGAPAPSTVAPGEHLVQARWGERVRGWWVVAGRASAATLVVPDAFAGPLDPWTAEAQRADLTALLAGVLGEGTEVEVRTIWGTVLRGTAGRAAFEVRTAASAAAPLPVPLPAPAPPPVPPRLAERRMRWTVPAAAISGGVALSAAVATGAALAATEAARRDYAEATSTGAAADAREAFDTRKRWVLPSAVACGIGSCVTTAMVVVHVAVPARSR